MPALVRLAAKVFLEIACKIDAEIRASIDAQGIAGCAIKQQLNRRRPGWFESADSSRNLLLVVAEEELQTNG